MTEGSNSIDAGEIDIHGQLSHLNSACGNLSSYNLKHKVRGEPCSHIIYISAAVTLLVHAETFLRLWLHLWRIVVASSRC
jgi:hypothetical protein